MTCSDWRNIVKNGNSRGRDFPAGLELDEKAVDAVRSVYPMFVNSYYAGLISNVHDAIARQVIPDTRELDDGGLIDDPLAETRQSPVPGIIHRYPDRAVFLVSNRCPILCRFCMRKRLAGRSSGLKAGDLAKAMDYIGHQDSIREVILSGGDPLLLDNDQLDDILAKIRSFSHVQVIRIHSRTPCALPQRITPELTGILKKYHPVYMNIHFNHPDEITTAVAEVCTRLASAGIPLGSQTVLLKDVNDSVDIIEQLMRRLLCIRVRPYYLHHPDLVRGTRHFRVPVKKGLAIMQALQGRLSGIAIPRYMIDLPGGGGKVPLTPDFIYKKEDGVMMVKNFQGTLFPYPMNA